MSTPATALPLDELCAELERSWIDRRDADAVDRLATLHPEHAAELYDFFTALVLGSRDATLPAAAARAAASRTRAWLEEEGFARAAAAARGAAPTTFVKFLRESCAASSEAIVERLGAGVTWELLAMVSRYPLLLPRAVSRELAARLEKAWKIPAAESLESLETSGPVPVAASRRGGPYPPAPADFAELLERSSLKAEERRYWLELASES